MRTPSRKNEIQELAKAISINQPKKGTGSLRDSFQYIDFNNQTFNKDFSKKHIWKLLEQMGVTGEFWYVDSPNSILEV